MTLIRPGTNSHSDTSVDRDDVGLEPDELGRATQPGGVTDDDGVRATRALGVEQGTHDHLGADAGGIPHRHGNTGQGGHRGS